MGALDGFGAEVEAAGGGVGAHGRVAGVCERAGLPVAEAGDVVFTGRERGKCVSNGVCGLCGGVGRGLIGRQREGVD